MRDEITLANGNKVSTGTWLEGAQGWTNTYRIIGIAEAHGFTMDDDERAALDWYKESSGGCGNGTDAEEDMAETVIGQGGLSDRATDHVEGLLPDGWTLLWDAGELSLVRDVAACAFHGGGCEVDYAYPGDREIVRPCYDHAPDYVIAVELLRTDDHWFSYGIKLVDSTESAIVHGHDDATFEAPGLDNLKVEGEFRHPSQIGAEKVREAAERLIAKYRTED